MLPGVCKPQPLGTIEQRKATVWSFSRDQWPSVPPPSGWVAASVLFTVGSLPAGPVGWAGLCTVEASLTGVQCEPHPENCPASLPCGSCALRDLQPAALLGMPTGTEVQGVGRPDTPRIGQDQPQQPHRSVRVSNSAKPMHGLSHGIPDE